MKHIRQRIMWLILAAALLLFCLCLIVVNVMIPDHFVREAKKALINEIQQADRVLLPHYNEETYDTYYDTGGEDAEEEYFFTPNIVFLELSGEDIPGVKSRETARMERLLIEYCKDRELSQEQCHSFRTDRHHLIFVSVRESHEGLQEPYLYVMYIDIGPVTRYIVKLNWLFFGLLLVISSVMCLGGFRIGRDIERESERQQTFFQNASHELKTPLMSIQGYAEGIQAGVLDAVSSAGVILTESERMTELVDELLAISKIDMNRQVLDFSDIDICELLYDSIREVEPVAGSNGICIVPMLPCEPVIVSCDDTLLRRAVINVLSNGVRYADRELHLTCREGRREITILIWDDGEGIAVTDLPHIFDRFYMGQSGKTGIGLALAKEIIGLHGGKIHAYNGDAGAVFEISLPVSGTEK